MAAQLWSIRIQVRREKIQHLVRGHSEMEVLDRISAAYPGGVDVMAPPKKVFRKKGKGGQNG